MMKYKSFSKMILKIFELKINFFIYFKKFIKKNKLD